MPSFATLLGVLREAVKAQPIVSYALGLLGISAAGGAILTIFKEPVIAIIALPVLLLLMAVLFAFASLTRSDEKPIKLAGWTFLWFGLIAFMLFVGILFSFIITGKPDLAELIRPVAFRSKQAWEVVLSNEVLQVDNITKNGLDEEDCDSFSVYAELYRRELPHHIKRLQSINDKNLPAEAAVQIHVYLTIAFMNLAYASKESERLPLVLSGIASAKTGLHLLSQLSESESEKTDALQKFKEWEYEPVLLYWLVVGLSMNTYYKGGASE